MEKCPCGTGQTYQDCCGKFITAKQNPATPEELMRSRYTAYTKANVEYIVRTMKSPALDNYDRESARKWAKRVKWLKLEVLNSSENQDQGTVEFKAHFNENNQKQVMHELSEFRRDNGMWYYIKGK